MQINDMLYVVNTSMNFATMIMALVSLSVSLAFWGDKKKRKLIYAFRIVLNRMVYILLGSNITYQLAKGRMIGVVIFVVMLVVYAIIGIRLEMKMYDRW